MLHKVICIDDDPIALLLSKMVIARANFATNVIALSNGEEAIAYLKNEQDKPHEMEDLLILLDLNMPVMDGWEFLEQFDQNLYNYYKNTKIILLSSSVDPNDIRKAKNFQMVLDFLPKPLTKEKLENIITKFSA
ncbi:response regulator [Flavobacterium pallidum]|uniref:Response regulator n=1 Tax=Flavobacterium pallidum TaxID=2172098 RepID=A0A2S1SHQ6_9FLAO|nr:response regulator [Flavobacterium pallidum]AWI25944.1 response regulator [Flavobacterium pallidum]